MMNPTPPGTLRPHLQERGPGDAPAVGLLGERKDGVLPPVALEVRRLHYFVDLLGAGYGHALRPDPLFRSLRAERIALGIDLPELDTVPLWSIRRGDGTVSIPFIEFILAQIRNALDRIRALADAPRSGVSRETIARLGGLVRLLDETELVGEATPSLPRLADTFVPGELLERLCGPDGLLPEIVRQCEALLDAMVAGPGH
jgi:hypothetical protein